MQSTSSSCSWTLPATFDGFRVVGLLDGGAMGDVYLARDTRTDRLAAVKVMAAGARDVHARARFAVEVSALARIDHANVVRFVRAGDVDGEPYVASEYVAGVRLDRVLSPVDATRAVAIARGLAHGLAAAHARAVLHRDVKPSNVILSRGGAPKLLDFGLARLVDLGPSASDRPAPSRWPVGSGPVRITLHDHLVGTPRFLAPELWAGGEATERTDLYAFGLVFYGLIAGRLPHPGLRGASLALSVMRDDPPPLSSLAPSAEPALCDVIDRCVARDPGRRPATVAAIAEELDALAVSQTGAVSAS